MFAIKVTETSKYGCVGADSMLISTTSNCVWPGDANGDKTVDASDALNVALGYGTKGPGRYHPAVMWAGQSCPDWTDTFAHALNYKHGDCNGDSLIDLNDTFPIWANFSRTHLKTLNRVQGKPGDAPLLISFGSVSGQNLKAGDWAVATVSVGNTTDQVKNLYGLSFNLNLNTSLIDTSTVQIDYSPSWYSNKGDK